MFKLQKNATFTHDVPVQMPVDDGHAEVMLKTKFRVLDADALRPHDDLTSELAQNAYLRAVIVGFPAVVDDDGQPIPDDDALFDRLMGLTFVRMALLRGYALAMAGARAKN